MHLDWRVIEPFTADGTLSSPEFRFIFAGGGTGGHLYPALAIANRITELLSGRAKVGVHFVGTTRGLEYRVKEQLGYPLHIIPVRGLVRSLTLKNLLVPFTYLRALSKATRLIEQVMPHVVVGTGGYVSLPVLRSAQRLAVCTVIQEQNSLPGIATRRAAHKAKRIYLGFAEATALLPSNGAIKVTGNPVRREINTGDRGEALKAFGLADRKKTILVLGGSQGARAINEAVLSSLKRLGSSSPFQLLWQTGKRDYTDVVAAAGETAQGHTLFPFENRMPLVYAAADVVIARAGALTLAELEACALPSILIPYPFAAGDHQMSNARAMQARGCAVVVPESHLKNMNVLNESIALLGSGKAEGMRSQLKKAIAGRRPAVDVIAEDIIGLLHNQVPANSDQPEERIES